MTPIPFELIRNRSLPEPVFFITESHSGIIGRIILDGSSVHPLQTWEATSPVKLQKMSERDFLTTRPESTIYSGLVKFRWPVFENRQWKYLPVKDHPFYSLEQYSGSFSEGYSDFVEAVAKRIDPIDYASWDKMEKVLDYTVHYVRERVPIVLEGYKRCHKGGCPEGSDLWEVHSTPNRDGKIILLMDHLHHLIESNGLDQDAVKEMMEGISIRIKKGQFVSFYHLYQNYLWLSPHPEDSIEARWGLKKCEMILSQLRSAHHTIDFIEKTYRKADPKYADFSIRQQQEIIRRLIEEWNRAKCKVSFLPTPEEDRKIERQKKFGVRISECGFFYFKILMADSRSEILNLKPNLPSKEILGNIDVVLIWIQGFDDASFVMPCPIRFSEVHHLFLNIPFCASSHHNDRGTLQPSGIMTGFIDDPQFTRREKD